MDKIELDDWHVRGVRDEVANAYFFLSRDKPKDMADFYASTRVCFLGDEAHRRYRAQILESTKRGRPKDLTFLGKCNEFHYPPNDTMRPDIFSWVTLVYTRDILWGYEKELELEGKVSK